MLRLPNRNVVGEDFANAKLEARRVFVPFASFVYFGMGNIFQRGRMIERASGYSNVYKSIFKPRFLTDGRFSRFGHNLPVGIQENFSYHMDEPIPRFLNHKIPILRGRDSGESAYLFMWEIIRFYLAGFSRMSEALISQLAYPEIDHPPLYDEAETGLDGNTFVITPTLGFADRATATQLAIILAHEDIFDLIQRFSDYLRLVRYNNADLIPRISMPSGAQALRLAVRKIGIIDPDGRKGRGKFYGQILSDGRELSFDRLIIRDPRERRKVVSINYQESDEENEDPHKDSLPKPEEKLNWPNYPDDLHGGDPSIGEKEVVSPIFSIDDHFTGLKQVPVKVKRSSIEVEKTVWDRLKKRINTEDKSPKLEKQYTHSGGAPVKGLWRFRPKMTPEANRLGAGQKLFLPVDVLPFEVVPVRSIKKDARIQTALDANQRLYRQSILRRSAIPKFASAEAMRLKIDLSGSCVTREVVYGFVSVAGRHGVWIEIVRKGERAISIGLVLRRDGREIGPIGVVRILEHFSRRVRLRGAESRDARDAYIGVWPIFRDYNDIVGDRVTHNPPNNTAYYLARTIDQKFRDMSIRATGSD